HRRTIGCVESDRRRHRGSARVAGRDRLPLDCRREVWRDTVLKEAAMSVSSRQIRVLTVDDHPLLREGIATLVNAEADMKLVAEASNGREAVQKFRSHRPDITLMDIQMPNMNGTEAISEIRREFPDARIIVFTTYTGDTQVLGALKAGARAYLLKADVHLELLDVIRAVHAGQKRIPPQIAAELAEHAADDPLSSREIDVVRLIATGSSNKVIADQL